MTIAIQTPGPSAAAPTSSTSSAPASAPASKPKKRGAEKRAPAKAKGKAKAKKRVAPKKKPASKTGADRKTGEHIMSVHMPVALLKKLDAKVAQLRKKGERASRSGLAVKALSRMC